MPLEQLKKTPKQKSLVLLYFSIFHCHLLYAFQIWLCSRAGPPKGTVAREFYLTETGG